MSTKPWRKAEEEARAVHNGFSDRLAAIVSKLRRNEIGVDACLAQLAAEYAKTEGEADACLERHRIPLDPRFGKDRAQNQRTREGLRDYRRATVLGLFTAP